ncbi:MAG: caspase family protein [Bacteroidota bacterium]
MAKDGQKKRGGFDLDGKDNADIPLGKSWFFGVGINQYQEFANLNNAVRDVRDVCQLLQQEYDISAETTTLLLDTDATRFKIISALDSLKKKIQPEDKFIIYYSGHGHLDEDGKGFWIPTDGMKENTGYYIRNSTIRDYIQDIKALHTLLISDSCFSGTLLLRGQNRSTAAVDELGKKKSRWAICSGRHDEEVYDGPPGGNSPFCESIIDTLKENKLPGLNVAKLADKVIELTRANYSQLPEGAPIFNAGHKGGQYIFKRKVSGYHPEKISLDAIKKLPVTIQPLNYLPSPHLVESLKTAIRLGQPLLLGGEPGVGKTQFAYYAAHVFDLGNPVVYNVRTSSTAKDLFYHYDEKAHLNYIHSGKGVLSTYEIESRFIKYVALGNVIRSNEQQVVLIDEIDKGSAEFINDLMNLIEGSRFYVNEIDLVFEANRGKEPIIIFTTNAEKSLPHTFLSRCIYHHISFPSQEHLLSILKTRFANWRNDKFLRQCVEFFLELRKLDFEKPPGIPEMNAWVKTLISQEINDISQAKQRKKLSSSYSVLLKTQNDLKKVSSFFLDHLG